MWTGLYRFVAAAIWRWVLGCLVRRAARFPPPDRRSAVTAVSWWIYRSRSNRPAPPSVQHWSTTKHRSSPETNIYRQERATDVWQRPRHRPVKMACVELRVHIAQRRQMQISIGFSACSYLYQVSVSGLLVDLVRVLLLHWTHDSTSIIQCR